MISLLAAENLHQWPAGSGSLRNHASYHRRAPRDHFTQCPWWHTKVSQGVSNSRAELHSESSLPSKLIAQIPIRSPSLMKDREGVRQRRPGSRLRQAIELREPRMM